MRVKEAMKRTLRTISPDRPLAEAAEIMKRYGVDHVVVKDHGAAVGLLSDGDIARHGGEGLVRSAMTKALVTIDADEPVRKAANMLRGHSIKSLVVTEGGKLAGIITSTDLLEVIARSGHKERMIMRDRGIRKRSGRM